MGPLSPLLSPIVQYFLVEEQTLKCLSVAKSLPRSQFPLPGTVGFVLRSLRGQVTLGWPSLDLLQYRIVILRSARVSQ